MSLSSIFLTVTVVIVLGLFASPEFWLLIKMARERGLQGTRVRLRDGLVGQVVRASHDFAVESHVSRGRIFTEGETWSARCAQRDATIREGDRLRIVSREGLTLLVEPVADE